MALLLPCCIPIGPFFFPLVFLVSGLLGLTFPVAVEMHHLDLARFGRTLGEVYSANTLGSIAGAFVTGFVLIPWLGTQRSLLLIAGIHLSLGIVYSRAGGTLRRPRMLYGLAALACSAALLLPPTLIWRRWFENREVLHLEENATEVVTVLADGRGA